MGDLSLKELKDLLDENDLDLSARNLTAVPKALAQVARATRIDLSNNKLTSLPPDLPQWTRITKLELGNNRLVQLPDDFGRLFNLKYLDLYKNQIEELPLSFADLTSLQWLDLKNNPLEPALAQAAGKCGNDKECKEAAAKVRQHITGLRDALKKKVEEPLLFVIMMQAEKNEAMLKKVREKEAAQLQQQKEAEKAKKKENRKAKQANHQEQQARNETQKHEQKSREQTTNASSNTANKKSQPAGDKKSGSFFGRFIMGLVRLILWSFVLTTIVVGASLFVNCRFPAYRWLKAADVQPICKDTAKAFSDFSIPDSAPTSLNRALNALVQDAQRRIQRNEWGSWLLSVAYKVHAVIVEYVLLGYKIILQQWNKIVAWWDREGRDSFGGVADSIVLTGKIMLEIVKDIWAFWMKALDVLYNRINLLVDTVQAKGFSKTVQDFFQGH